MVTWVVAILFVVIVGGCSKEPPAPQPEPVKTAAEYKAEADKQITEQNMNQELAKIEGEVNAETAADANQTK
jgi:hypothetical protein